MRFVFTFCVFLLNFFSCFSQSNFQFEKDKSKISIPFQLINNLIFIPINVNGQELTFLLDTGVEETILFSLDENEELKLYHLEKIRLKGLGNNDAVDAYKSSKNRFEVNGFADNNHEIYLVLDQEFNFSSQVGIPVNGIIGYHFFKNHLIEIDYSRKKVFIYNETNTKIQKKLSTKYKEENISVEENKPYYLSNVTSEGSMYPSKLLIDTGNSDAIWLFLNKAKKIKLPKKHISDYLGRGFSGDVYGLRGRIDDFSFGSRTFKNPITTFPDSTSVRSVNFVADRVGSLGGEVLSRFTIAFDYSKQKMYSKPNNKINEPFNFNMSGIEVQHDGLEWVKNTYEDKGKVLTPFSSQNAEARVQDNLKIKFELKPVFTIYSVRKDSPADLAGLKKNDRLLAIEGKSTHDLTIEKINGLLKSEEGKSIELVIERAGKRLTYEFQLKSIL
jgi:hypothetical protein